MDQTHGHERRRRYMVDKRFQIRYMIMIILVLALCIAVGISLAAVAFQSVSATEELGSLERLSKLNFIFWIILLAVLVLLVAVGFYGLRLSHRVAGPVYAFSRHLDFIRRGVYYNDLKLRKRDEFKNLANSFNATLEALRTREKESIASLEEIVSILDNLSKLLAQEPATESEAAKLRELVAKINGMIKVQKARIESQNTH